MKSLVVIIVIALTLAGSIAAAERTMTFGKFDTVTVYAPHDTPRSVVLFISGDGGWNAGVVDMARILEAGDAIVVGVNIVRYEKKLAAASEACSYPAADFELLSKFVQLELKLPQYIEPVLVGYSSGATLAYALLAQAPQGTFKGAISMGFCPDLPLTKPLCEGSGLRHTAGPKGKGFSFLPRKDLSTPWIAFQGTADQVCSAGTVDAFVKQIPSARVISLPKVGHGFSVEKNWVPQFKEAFSSLVHAEAPRPHAVAGDTTVGDLPLVEVSPEGPATDDLAVLITGDGGWAGIDKEIAAALAKAGIAVVGLNSLKYFWDKRTPQQTSRDVDRIIRHYAAAWKKSKVILIGYSFGADVLPFCATRLPPGSLDKVCLMVMLGLSPSAEFHFKVSGWMGGGPSKDALPVLPEIEKLRGKKMVYFYGVEESDNVAGSVNRALVKVIPLAGGHHFHGRFDVIADSILANLRP